MIREHVTNKQKGFVEIIAFLEKDKILFHMDDSTDAAKVIGWKELQDKGLQAKLALRKRRSASLIGFSRVGEIPLGKNTRGRASLRW